MSDYELFRDANDAIFIVEYPPEAKTVRSYAVQSLTDEHRDLLFKDPQIIVSGYQLDGMDDEELVEFIRYACDRVSLVHAKYASQQLIDEPGKAIELAQRYGAETARRVAKGFSKYAHEFEIIERAVNDLYTAAETVERPTVPELPPQKKRCGHIYVVLSAGYYKIGRAKEVTRRVYQFSTEYPYPVELVMSAPADDMIEKEAQLHQHFADKRVRGEWFSLDEGDLATIREMLSING